VQRLGLVRFGVKVGVIYRVRVRVRLGLGIGLLRLRLGLGWRNYWAWLRAS